MERYKNLGGDSNIAGYDIGPDSITIKFKSNDIYIYTYQSAGKDNIERMKSLAVSGCGLNSFIMRHVKKSYASKL